MSDSVPLRLWRRYNFFSSLSELLAHYPPDMTIIIGTLASDWQQHVAAESSEPKRIILVDDGVGEIDTVLQATFRKGQLITAEDRTLRRRIVRLLLGRNTLPLVRMEWFTSYQVDMPPQLRVKTNDRAWLRDALADTMIDESNAIVGQPFVELGRVTVSQYCRAVASIARRYRDIRPVYHPHRRECASKIRRIESTLGIEIAPTELPIELSFVEKNSRPCLITGFSSSALISCAQVMGNNTRIIRHVINIPGFDVPSREAATRLSSVFEAMGVRSEHIHIHAD